MDSIFIIKIDRIYRIIWISCTFPVPSGNREKIQFILLILSDKKNKQNPFLICALKAII